MCGKLLSTSEDTSWKWVDQDGDADELNEDFADETEGEMTGSSTLGGGMLLGHARLYTNIDLVFCRHIRTGLGLNNRRVRDEDYRWEPKSACLKLYGVRVGLMEELLELLKQRLHIPKHAPPGVPTPPVTFASPVWSASFHPTRSGDSHTAAVLFSQSQTIVGTSTSVAPLSRSVATSLAGSSTAFHVCLSVLPLRLMATNSTDRSGRSCLRAQHTAQETEDIAFRFELIRFIFRRSLQLKFYSFLFTGIVIPPLSPPPLPPTPHNKSSHGSSKWNSAWEMHSAHLFPTQSNSSNAPDLNPCQFCPPPSSDAKGLFVPESGRHVTDESIFFWPGPDAIRELESDSSRAVSCCTGMPKTSEKTIIVRLKLTSLHLLNGWIDAYQNCSLDCNFDSVVLDFCSGSASAWYRLLNTLMVHMRVGISASTSNRQPMTSWSGIRSHMADGCWSRFEKSTAEAFTDPLDANLEHSPDNRKEPEILIRIASDSCPSGLQLGLDSLVFDQNSNLLDSPQSGE
ncbi:unnamed protein product [Echinostoma caproni]|uniref:MAM domain-containing protein n=1 Tax=Echinostoma caproni TaxID=27848 RepID=A0A183AZG1_9TREM|nr:unnamed protein product [Echinostoma caproni]